MESITNLFSDISTGKLKYHIGRVNIRYDLCDFTIVLCMYYTLDTCIYIYEI